MTLRLAQRSDASAVADLLDRFTQLSTDDQQVFLSRVTANVPTKKAVAFDLNCLRLPYLQRQLLSTLIAAGLGVPVPITDVLRAVYGHVAREVKQRRAQVRTLKQLRWANWKTTALRPLWPFHRLGWGRNWIVPERHAATCCNLTQACRVAGQFRFDRVMTMRSGILATLGPLR